VDVFVAVYDAVGIRSLASLWRQPWLRPLWNRLYPWVARNRDGLSRLGLPRMLTWVLRGLAWAGRRRLLRSARRCATGACRPG
jgi:predicted DCC family thiol-disulfide oxidoreductase YuxK